ncbi:substrate-binding domain-containing protein [Actinomadura opuntiae]|uniref:substrate-binding domain-containing protein n=1 Tax=Actinomadura sp. OS1-43 TaxID=604315 RepID=UPI00255AE537|nr:substrate-binding domain-containing protein [Actinomadura sp. OS1-43]MDL4814669.1 substrate-binding domain-containing protein [Actinomadura sp. OS1-43]
MRWKVWVPAAVLLVTVVGGGAWAFGLLPGPSPCRSGTVEVRVAAQPEIAPALRDVASRFTVERHRVGGRCVRARVTAVAPAEFARRPDLRRRTDAWVPESSLWLGIVRDAGDKGVPGSGTSIAATPVVFATTRPVADELAAGHVAMSWKLLLKSKVDGLGLARRAADPGVGISGMVAMLALDQVGGRTGDVTGDLRKSAPSPADDAAGGAAAVLAGLTAAERFDRPLVVTTEQATVAYNDGHRPNPVTPIVPDEGTLMLDHPYAVTARDRRHRDAAAAFGDALGTRSARDTLQRAGFRAPDGGFGDAAAREHGLPATAPRSLRLPTRKEIDRALASWKA